jgi:hypothetical protein
VEDASEEALEDEEANDYSTYKAGLDEGVPPENDDSIESVAKDKREDVFDVANADNIMENNGDIRIGVIGYLCISYLPRYLEKGWRCTIT